MKKSNSLDLCRGTPITAVVALGYALIAVCVTYPVVFQLATALAGLENKDAVGKMWMLWWSKKALLDLQINPAHLSHLYHPTEPYHPLLIAYPFLQFLALPVLLTAGPIVAYNLEFLLSFALSGLAMYFLCYYLTKNHISSFIAGVIFAFFPNKMLHSMGHLPVITLYLLPVYVLFLFRLRDKPSLRRGLGLGLVLALSLLVHIIHVAYFLIPFTLVFLLWHLFVDRPRILAAGFWKGLAVAVLVASALTAPFLGPLVVGQMSGDLSYLRAEGSEVYSADLLNFFAPSADHPVLGRLLAQLPLRIPGHRDDESLVYLGFTTLALVAVGSRGDWKGKGMWVALALAAGLLSCGPLLRFGGQVLELGFAGQVWRVPLPYAVVDRLPFYEWGRTPARLVETLMFSLAILASYGTASVIARLRSARAKVALAAALTGLLLFEYLIVFPFPTGQIAMPDFYRELAADPEDYAILDIPLRGWAAQHTSMYYQIVHGHRIVGGFIHRVPSGVSPMLRVFESLARPHPEAEDIVEPLTIPERAAVLEYYDIAFVVLHKPLLASEQLRDLDELMESISGDRAYEDEHIVAFGIPSSSGETAERIPLLELGSHWYSTEYQGEVPYRWMARDATIKVWAHEVGKYELRFEAQSFDEPRQLEVFVDGELLGLYRAGELQSYVTPPFTLEGREWATIRFHAPQGCDKPSEVLEASGDDRCLSVLLRELSIGAAG